MQAQLAAFRVLRKITKEQAYAQLAIAPVLVENPNIAPLITELVYGTCRGLGSYDQIIALAAQRRIKDFQPAVVDILRLGTHQLLAMDIPAHAAINETVNAAAKGINPRVKGVVNAVLRKISARNYAQWIAELSKNTDELSSLALAQHHPQWIVEKYAEILPLAEVEKALVANNKAALPTLCIRPGLLTQKELLVESGGEPTKYVSTGVYYHGNPERLGSIKKGLAGVQDEGSQLLVLAAVATALAKEQGSDNEKIFETSKIALPEIDKQHLPLSNGKWLDLCAGPGGKSALLAGLVAELECVEIQAHRAQLVQKALRAYPQKIGVQVLDGRKVLGTPDSPWVQASFDYVFLDAPCSGLGALRRRPDARWRKENSDLIGLTRLQRELLETAILATKTGGLVFYATCSPVLAETSEIIQRILAQNPSLTLLNLAEIIDLPKEFFREQYLQLWPHLENTDAMFMAAIRV